MKKPIIALVCGIVILILPTFIYLCFLIPKMSSEYNALMASGGVISGGGLYGASQIPEKLKYAGLFKTASKSFSIAVTVYLIQDFVTELIVLFIIFMASYIIFYILREVYRNGKQLYREKRLAGEISRSFNEHIK